MPDKKTNTKPQDDNKKESNSVFSSVPLKLTTYADHSYENTEKTSDTLGNN